MNPVLYRILYAIVWVLEQFPGYCRTFTIGPSPSYDWNVQWSWLQHPCWGFRLLDRLRLDEAFIDEVYRRHCQRNPSSVS